MHLELLSTVCSLSCSSRVLQTFLHRVSRPKPKEPTMRLRCKDSYRCRPLRGLRILSMVVPGVSLRSTPGFMLSPATAGWIRSTMTNQPKTLPSLARSIMTGGVGFSLVSLCVFATVAFGERWMYAHLGMLGAYLVWTALFIILGGAVLGSLVVGRWRLPKFYLLYGIAFFAYAVGWVGAYFTLRSIAGEWVGSVAGSILMALVFALGFAAHTLHR